MTNIVVLIKQVPDTWSERKLTDGDFTLDREAADAVLAGAVLIAWALARALGTIEGVDLVIAGNEATDGVGGAVPAVIAEYLGLPQLTHVRKLTVDGDKVTAERETDDGVFTLEATLPAIVSVNEKINEPRFPSFKGSSMRCSFLSAAVACWPVSRPISSTCGLRSG